MKFPFNAGKSSVDGHAISATIERALAAAGLDTRSGTLREVTQTIRRALGATAEAAPAATPDDANVIDVTARVVPTEAAAPLQGRADDRPDDQPAAPPAVNPPAQAPGRFSAHVFSHAAGSRSYKLYVPASLAGTSPPMIVMLHGCTQSADDFAAGTQMNRQADEHGFLVVYPEQSAQANSSRCWNWFQPQDQGRDTGEPALIAGLVDDVARRHGADPRRIFVAGLSAGAAMAVVLGETHPERFAGIGVHSGLPYASAHDIPSAMAAMKGGRSGLSALSGLSGLTGLGGLMDFAGGASATPRQAVQAVPIIIFHGDRDHTVQQTNGEHIARQARDAHGAQAGPAGLSETAQAGTAPSGRRYSRTVHADAQGQPLIESWTIHGAGHAWSGGHPSGSYTDPTGPDASAEMVRFFLALPPA